MVGLGGWGSDAGGLCARMVWLLYGGVHALQVHVRCCFMAVVSGVGEGVYGYISQRSC